jgi:hypothetical protein
MKPNAVLAVPAFLLLLLQRRADRSRTLAGALAGAAVVSAGFLVAYRSVLDRLWESVVVYHQDARDTPDVIDKTEQLVHFLNWRTPFAWLVLAGLIGSVLLLRSRYVRGLWALWSWPAITLLFLVYHHPLHENHLLALPVALAAPVGVALGALVTQGPVKHLAVAALALALAAGYVQQHRRVALEDHPEEPELVRAASVLRAATEPDDLVVSDQPIVAYLARRRVAGPLVDTAQLRFETGSLSNGEVLRILAEEDVKAVVVGRALGRRPGLLRRLDDRYRVFRRVDGIAIYVAR